MPAAPGAALGLPSAVAPPPRALGEAQRARLAALLDGAPAPTRQDVAWLGILVDFSDRQLSATYGEDFDPLNVLGYPDSVVTTPRREWFTNLMTRASEYYATVSAGAVALHPTLADSVVHLSGTMNHYGDDSAFSWEEGVRRLAAEVVDSLDAAIDFSAWDLVTFIHAGPGQESDLLRDSPEQLWSGYLDFASLSEAFADSLPDPPVDGWPGIPTDDGGFVLQRFSVAPELEVEEQLSPPYVLGPLGVYVHQLGSYLGLVSLNDLVPPQGQGAGNFDLMSYGLWNALGFVPGPPSAFNRVLQGWATPDLLPRADATAAQARQLASWEQGPTGTVLELPVSDREYFLVENRNQDANGDGAFTFDDANGNHLPDNGESLLGAEFDYFTTQYNASDQTPGSGLFVWRIDEEFLRLTFQYDVNLINAYNDHYGVALLEADGYPDLTVFSFDENAYGGDFDAFRAAGGPNDLVATQTAIDQNSLPSTRSAEGADSGWRFSGIGPHGPSMDFTVRWEPGAWARAEWSAEGRLPVGDPLLADLLADPGDLPEFAFLLSDGADSLFVAVQPAGAGFGEPVTIAALTGVPAGALAGGDLDGDGADEIVLLTRDGRLFAWKGDGTNLSGTPGAPLLTVAGASAGPLLLAASALGVVGDAAVIVLFEDQPDDGGAGFSATVPRAFDGAGAALDLAAAGLGWELPQRGLPMGPPALGLAVAPGERGYGHGAASLAFVQVALADTSGTGAAKVLRLASPPAAAAGWAGVDSLAIPLSADAALQLAAGDLDADGVDDLLVETASGLSLWFPAGRLGGAGDGETLFRADETAVHGSGLALLPADLGGDGLAVALAAGAGAFAAVGPEGGALSTWLFEPGQTDPDPGFWADPVRWLLLRRDADGRDHPLLATYDGRVFVGRADLAAGAASQFPGGDLGGSPVLADLDGDGLLELRGLSGFTPATGNTAGEDTLLAGAVARVWQLDTDLPAAGASWAQAGADAGRSRRLPLATGFAPATGGARLTEAYGYPNPAGESVTWRASTNTPAQITVTLYDLEGQQRLRVAGATDGYSAWERESSLVGLAPGVYFYTIRAEGSGDLRKGRLAVLR